MCRFFAVCLAVIVCAPVVLSAEEGPDQGQVLLSEVSSPARQPSGRLGPLATLTSQKSLFSYLADLTTIMPHQGWRYSAARGEAEAVDYVEEKLLAMDHLVALGLEIERQEFHTMHGTEFWEVCLDLTVDGTAIEVPADSHPGLRGDLVAAMVVDSDGAVNDSDSDPIEVDGVPLVVTSSDQLMTLTANDVEGRIVFVDYGLIDYYAGDQNTAFGHAGQLLDIDPAGIVLVTSFSNVLGESHGTVAGDLNAFVFFGSPAPPILNIRIEDLADLGITTWDDFGIIESAQMTLDIDVFAPGTSRNLVARIPGEDPSRAIILSAHIDSPNNPGGTDDGSGSVSLLEVARVINSASLQPPVDLYIVWYGSHERGLYGSANFTATHQELLDRTIAVFNVDCISVPLEGRNLDLYLTTDSYARFGDDRMTWPDYISQLADDLDVTTISADSQALLADHSNYGAWDVPNLNLIYMDLSDGVETHYGGHLHTPYDTVDLVRSEGDTLENMALLSLAAVLYTGADDPVLRVTPEPDLRVLLIASHTEGVHMTNFTNFGMALAWEGFDLDLIPYGQAVTAQDLAEAAMVVVLPVHDYPSSDGDVTIYDEAWTVDEIDSLEAFVDDGGLLVLTNSNSRIGFGGARAEANEDWSDVNDLAGRFGVEYQPGSFSNPFALTVGDAPLTENLGYFVFIPGNAVPFTFEAGESLALVRGEAAVAMLASGVNGGEVLVLPDIGVFSDNQNLAFWQNLMTHIRSR